MWRIAKTGRARKLYPKRKPVDSCQIGIRRYDRELHTSDNTAKGDFPCKGKPGSLDYAASSFWQFLGEYATREGIDMATEEFSPPDFRYLHNFFRTTHPMGELTHSDPNYSLRAGVGCWVVSGGLVI